MVVSPPSTPVSPGMMVLISCGFGKVQSHRLGFGSKSYTRVQDSDLGFVRVTNLYTNNTDRDKLR